MNPVTFEVAVVGAGLVGLSTALALARKGRTVTVLEAEPEVGWHQSGHNSGVIHSGVYYTPGSLKARNCTAGRTALYQLCADQGIPHQQCGKLIVARNDAELPVLEDLAHRAARNHLEGVIRLDVDGIREREPHVAGIAALFVPQTGVVDFAAVSRTVARLITEQGQRILTRARVRRITVERSGVRLDASEHTIRCRLLINCAGLQCDRIARMCGVRPPIRIIPFRGQYHQLTESRAHLVKHLVYPVPDPRFPFLGVHLTRTIHGAVTIGPNATLALSRDAYDAWRGSPRDLMELMTYGGFWRMIGRWWRTGAAQMWLSLSRRALIRDIRQLVPAVTAADLRPAGCGIRAQAVDRRGRLVDDFCIVESRNTLHVLNAPSPAATASLAIGENLASRALERL